MKNKITLDPQNLSWANDKERFGYRMLGLMGWSEGKGLGSKENGITAHVTAVKRQENLGIGADINTSNNWLSNTSAFSDVLTRLQSIGAPANGTETSSNNSAPTSIKNRRIRYHKLVNAKTLTNHSSEDISAILIHKKNTDSDDDDADSNSTVPSTVVVQKRKREDSPSTGKKIKLDKKEKSKRKDSSRDSSSDSSSDESCASDSSSSDSSSSSSDESDSDAVSSNSESSDSDSSDSSSSEADSSEADSSDADSSDADSSDADSSDSGSDSSGSD
jgi:Pin2-interacting protein X1